MKMRVTLERIVYLQVDVEVPDGPVGIREAKASADAQEKIRADGWEKFYLAADVPEVMNVEAAP